MEEIDDNDAQKIAGLQDEQQPSTSQEARRSKSPRIYPHNASDLTILEYNSADDVRQTLKSALATPSASKNDHDVRNKNSKTEKIQNKKTTSRAASGAKTQMLHLSATRSTPSKTPILSGSKRNTSREGERELHLEVQHENQRDIQREVQREALREGQPGSPVPKRRGRPPKSAGPSKRRRTSVTDYYNGKLSNLIHLSRRGRSHQYSDSDFDSRSG